MSTNHERFLAHICGLSSRLRRERYMAVLAAYFDDSGSDDHSSHYVVGGFLARVEDWVSISDVWDRLVRSWGLEWFHMVDAESMSGEGLEKRNAYGWDWQEREAKLRILGALVECMAGFGVACAVDRALWDEHVKTKLVGHAQADHDFGFPYLDAYTGCLAQVSTFCKKADVSLADVDIFFAEQKKHGHKAREAVRRLHSNFGLRDPHFDTPQRVPALQVADVMAWLANLSARTGADYKPRPRHAKFVANQAPIFMLDSRWTPILGRMLEKASSSPGRVNLADLEEIMRRP